LQTIFGILKLFWILNHVFLSSNLEKNTTKNQEIIIRVESDLPYGIFCLKTIQGRIISLSFFDLCFD
jgi:hypothetical protein